MRVRKAAHCGSWYTSNKKELDSQLTEWLSSASSDQFPARAIITPHAGYSYSGPCAGFAYKQIDPSNVKKIFILGPSHKFSLGQKCALTCAHAYETPFYNLPIDHDVFKQLESTGEFVDLDLQRDQNEHSLEMQLPYIAKVMQNYKDEFTIVPIMVGGLSPNREAVYGRILAPYLADPSNLFVISSDFCHWGRRFDYTYYNRNHGDIWESIERLDREGMRLIEELDPPGFARYLAEFGNTICGRHPIGVLLNAIEALRSGAVPSAISGKKFNLRFTQYAQSQHCHNIDDSSVSYASAGLLIQ